MKVIASLTVAGIVATLAPAQVRQGNLQVGALAPDFMLKVRGEDREIRLSDYRGHRPVALVFGSFT